jgi:hypothetical protein
VRRRAAHAPRANDADPAAAQDGVAAGSVSATDTAAVADAAADGALVAATAVPAPGPGMVTASGARQGPAVIRGIYLNAYAAGSTNRLNSLLALADSTEINTFVIDVKDERGIRYRSGVELAMELAQPGEVTIRDLPALARACASAASGAWPASSSSRTRSWRQRSPSGRSAGRTAASGSTARATAG